MSLSRTENIFLFHCSLDTEVHLFIVCLCGIVIFILRKKCSFCFDEEHKLRNIYVVFSFYYLSVLENIWVVRLHKNACWDFLTYITGWHWEAMLCVITHTQWLDNHQDIIVYVGFCVCICVCVCTFVITLRKCLFMFDWVGPDGTLGTFKQTISTSCLRPLSGATAIEKGRKKPWLRWTAGHLCKILSWGPL